ncbi:hypothetical protein HID58_073736 [Brassica napus]|uniref:Uncharacterized protein n=1 Tax=Brassica napus TaxID=3708 RepID=A0ABQ7XEY7_BRANA|nr:hypothetical protein HID58_073736 [Brassica napus]
MGRHRIITSLAPSSLGTCYLDKQLLGDISDTFRDYLREIQVESQAVYVQRLLEEESSGKSSCTIAWASLKCSWSFPSFSKEAVKSVERGRLKSGP